MDNVRIKSLNFYCTNTSATQDFFNYVFDAQTINANDEIELELMGMRTMLFEQQESSPQVNPFLSIEVASKEEITEFFQKLRFYAYKEASDELVLEKEDDYILFKDPDQRIWEISSKSHNI